MRIFASLLNSAFKSSKKIKISIFVLSICETSGFHKEALTAKILCSIFHIKPCSFTAFVRGLQCPEKTFEGSLKKGRHCVQL